MKARLRPCFPGTFNDQANSAPEFSERRSTSIKEVSKGFSLLRTIYCIFIQYLRWPGLLLVLAGQTSGNRALNADALGTVVTCTRDWTDMPTPGKSLFGFMTETAAVEYLSRSCVPSHGEDEAALKARWAAANAALGPAVPNAGLPDIQPFPQSHMAHVEAIGKAPWIAPWAPMLVACQFALIEIEPLLAYQHHIDQVRSDHHCDPVKGAGLDELLPICLPLTPPHEPFTVIPGNQSVLITARSLNLRNLHGGVVENSFAGMMIGPGLPFVHVVRLEGKCYLHNGFHRAYGARLRGATHIPCILRDVNTAQEAGIQANGSTFDETVLKSANAPTLSHFTSGRAADVQLRIFTRSLHVSWAEYAVPAE